LAVKPKFDKLGVCTGSFLQYTKILAIKRQHISGIVFIFADFELAVAFER
jgi:hypothetical protein